MTTTSTVARRIVTIMLFLAYLLSRVTREFVGNLRSTLFYHVIGSVITGLGALLHLPDAALDPKLLYL